MEAEVKDKENAEIRPKVSNIQKTTKIKKVVIEGFKSFAKYTEFLMGDEFNIILGPNGSGKSNVLDALCFVLGKSSSKSLRAEKSANLIYNGGKTKNPSKQAEVSIWLDNSHKVFPLPDNEIKISRIVRKVGTSKYKINNRTCTRAEILELLSSVKVNPNGYNIILQGDITRLIEMSPIERRQVMEEVAGIGVYEEKKNQALNELAKVENKLNEAEIILKERANYLKDLKKDRNQALKHKELHEKLKQNKASYCHVQIVNKKKSIEQFSKKMDTHTEKLDKADDEIAKLKQIISEKKKETDDIAKDIESKSEKEQLDIQKQVENLRVEIATKKTKISDLAAEKNKVLQRMPQLEQDLKVVGGKKKDIDEKKAELKAQRSAIKTSLGDLSAKVDAFRQKHNIDDIVEVEKEMELVEKDIEVKQKEIEEFRVQQQDFLREKDKIDFQLQTIDDKLKKIKSIKSAHKDEINALEQKKKEFEKATNELNSFLDSDSKSAGLLGELRKQINQDHEALAKLKVKQAAIKESMQSNAAVKKILANKNKFGGVFGTMAELASADEKFSMALEVAAANKMHSVVVEDDKTAGECIKFLKSQKVGVATFLPLNKIKPAKINDFKKIPGVFDLAINLVSFDPKFQNAFSYVFGRTLIVKDLETSRKVGIGNIRMVTLEGDLIEKSGVMSGGFRAKKVVFKEKNLESNITKLESGLKELDKRINKLSAERQKNEENIFKLRGFKANLEGDIIKSEKSLHLEAGDVDKDQSYKKDLMEEAKKIDKGLENVENKISDVMSEFTQLKIKKQEFKNNLTSLRSPVVLAELNAFEEKRKDFTTQLIKVEGEMSNLDLRLKDILGKDEENTKKLFEELKKELDDFEKDKNNLQKKVNSLEKDLKVKEEEQAKFMTQFKSLFDKRNKVSEEISKVEDKLLKSEEISRKEELAVNSLSIEQARFKTEFKGLELEFEQYEGIELVEKPEEQLKKEIISYERSLIAIGSVNMRALDIYDTVETEYTSLLEKKAKLSDEKKSVVELMDEIELNKKDLFMKTLNVIDDHFRNIFIKLTTKGEAFLELENKDSPFEAGLRIKVKLTGDKFLDLRSLSGGEKSLTALAFLFSIQEHEPAPFYILDEVDAALDKANSEKLARLIREYCKNAQYIVISHNDEVISEGDVLYGVSMKSETGTSSAVSIKMS